MQDTKKKITKTQPSTGTQTTDLAEIKATLKKIEELLAKLLEVLPYKK